MNTNGLDRNGRAQEALIYVLLRSLGEPTSLPTPHSATLTALRKREMLIRNEQGHYALTDGALSWVGWFIGTSQPGIRVAAERKQIIDHAHAVAAVVNERADEHVAMFEFDDDARRADVLRAFVAGVRMPANVPDAPRRDATPLLDEPACMVSSHRSNIERCTLPVSHAPGTNHSWAPADLAPCSTEVQRAALAADQEHKVRTGAAADATTPENTPEKVGTLEHERRAELATDAEDSAVWPATEHERYGADERWTYVGPGGLFRLAGGDSEPQVHATVVAGHHGRFAIGMLGQHVADVERAPDGMWREVFGTGAAERCGG